MAAWPFSKKNKETQADALSDTGAPQDTAAEQDWVDQGDEEQGSSQAAGIVSGAPRHHPDAPDFGPFDGDEIDYREFNFSDFAKGGLDLGSMMVPVPHDGEVQVEMGDSGPQMVHIVTPFGRVTPVAFAAPKGEDMWANAVPDIIRGMAGDGLEATTSPGPWGEEISASAGDGAMRVIGASGPRWMLRMTIAGPHESADQLAALTREMIARTFVMRGSDPIPAGNPLPVELPQAMVEELARHLQAYREGNQGESGQNNQEG